MKLVMLSPTSAPDQLDLSGCTHVLSLSEPSVLHDNDPSTEWNFDAYQSRDNIAVYAVELPLPGMWLELRGDHWAVGHPALGCLRLDSPLLVITDEPARGADLIGVPS